MSAFSSGNEKLKACFDQGRPSVQVISGFCFFSHRFTNPGFRLRARNLGGRGRFHYFLPDGLGF
jgi:hypothetical protein